MINIDLIPTHTRNGDSYAMWYDDVYVYSISLACWQPTNYDTINGVDFTEINSKLLLDSQQQQAHT